MTNGNEENGQYTAIADAIINNGNTLIDLAIAAIFSGDPATAIDHLNNGKAITVTTKMMLQTAFENGENEHGIAAVNATIARIAANVDRLLAILV